MIHEIIGWQKSLLYILQIRYISYIGFDFTNNLHLYINQWHLTVYYISRNIIMITYWSYQYVTLGTDACMHWLALTWRHSGRDADSDAEVQGSSPSDYSLLLHVWCSIIRAVRECRYTLKKLAGTGQCGQYSGQRTGQLAVYREQ